MGELVVLSEWKIKHALKELADLEDSVNAWIEFLGYEREYYIFDNQGFPIKLDSTGIDDE